MTVADLSHVQVRLVDDLDSAQEFMRWLGERRPILACDTETTGLGWWTPNFVRLMQFGDGQTGWAWDHQEWRGLSRAALTAVRDARVPVAFHNASFDLHAIEHEGFPVPDIRRVHDTKVMSHMTGNLGPHSLKPMSDRVWPGASDGQAMLKSTMAKHKWTWATVPTDHPHYWAYGALDTVLTALHAERLWPKVAPFDAAYEREMAVQHVMYRAERRGMRIDPTYTAELLSRWADEAEVLKRELEDLGVKNPSSNRQVQDALEAAGWEPEEFTPTGAAKLDKVVLMDLIKALGVNAEVAKRVLRYKRLVKWCSAYLTTFLECRDSNDRVHASINTLAARTGRMSIQRPALQTLPSRDPVIKNCVLPFEGDVLYAIDYDGQEARIFASLSQDPEFIRAFLEGLDVHRYTASLAYGIPYEDIDKEDPRRQLAKNFRYAQMYGAGDEKMAKTGGIPVEEVKEFRRRSDAAFPGIPRFMDEVDKVARTRMVNEKRAYVRTLGGRELECEPDKLYSLVNYLIQGSGADVLKQAIVDLDAAGLGDYIVIPVHDEVLFSFPEAEAAEMAHVAKEVMEDHSSYAVPLTCEATGPLTRWGAKYE